MAVDYLENLLVSTVGLSGSSGTCEASPIFAPLLKIRCCRERRRCCPLEPVLGGLLRIKIFESRSPTFSGALAWIGRQGNSVKLATELHRPRTHIGSSHKKHLELPHGMCRTCGRSAHCRRGSDRQSPHPRRLSNRLSPILSH